jgi:molybdenum cofactor cytidylyltransferase
VKLFHPIAGIILSAGASRRMGTPKGLLRLENETFLDRLIRLFSDVASPVIVVLGHHAEQIRSSIERAAQAVIVVNPDPERGMLSSLQCGLQAVPHEAEAVMFTPVDHPHLQLSTIKELVGQFEAHRAPVITPSYQGQHGHPVLIARPLIAELLALPPQAQASEVIHRYRSQTSYIEVDDPAVTQDIDDPTAYAELVAQRLPPAAHRP